MGIYRNDKDLSGKAGLDNAVLEAAKFHNWSHEFTCDVQECFKTAFEVSYSAPYEFAAGDDWFRVRWDKSNGTELTLYGWQGDATEEDSEIPLELDVAVREIQVRDDSTDPDNPGAAMRLLKRELSTFREKGKSMATNNRPPPDGGRDIYGNLTLPGLLKALEALFEERGWGREFLAALCDFVTKLYGDKPDDIMGPGYFEHGTGYGESADYWVEFVFENENAGYRDVIGLRWKDGKLWVRCEISKDISYEGVESTLRIMRDRCELTTTLGGGDDGRWRVGDCAVAPVGHVAGEKLFRIALVTGINTDGSLAVDTLIHGSAGAMTVSDGKVLSGRDEMPDLLKRFGVDDAARDRMGSSAERYVFGRKLMEEALAELAVEFQTIPERDWK